MFNKLTFPIGLRFLNVTKDDSMRKAALAMLFCKLLRESGRERKQQRSDELPNP